MVPTYDPTEHEDAREERARLAAAAAKAVYPPPPSIRTEPQAEHWLRRNLPCCLSTNGVHLPGCRHAPPTDTRSGDE